MCIVVHSAAIQDRRGVRKLALLMHKEFSSIKKIFVDGGYTGEWISRWFQNMFCWVLEVVKRTEQHRFVPLKKRWIVERTFGWMNWYRRLSKDYEYSTKYSEAQFKIANIRLILRRF
jgi:putative transposase